MANGFVVADSNGNWPTTWPTHELADIVGATRARLAALPRGTVLVRGEPCWLGPRTHGERYSRIGVARGLALAMGLSASGRRKRIKGHRLSFFVFNGHQPVLGTVDHVCRRRVCCNPAHLDDATAEDNNRRPSHRRARQHTH